MAKNKETQNKEAAAKVASNDTTQDSAAKVVEQTLEDFDVSKVESLEDLDAIEASEKEGKNRTGAFEIIEKRRSELQEEAKNTKSPDVKIAEKSKKETSSKKSSGKGKSKKKVKILASNMSGKYLLSFGKDEVVELEAKQADEMIEAGDAKEV